MFLPLAVFILEGGICVWTNNREQFVHILGVAIKEEKNIHVLYS